MASSVCALGAPMPSSTGLRCGCIDDAEPAAISDFVEVLRAELDRARIVSDGRRAGTSSESARRRASPRMRRGSHRDPRSTGRGRHRRRQCLGHDADRHRAHRPVGRPVDGLGCTGWAQPRTAGQRRAPRGRGRPARLMRPAPHAAPKTTWWTRTISLRHRASRPSAAFPLANGACPA